MKVTRTGGVTSGPGPKVLAERIAGRRVLCFHCRSRVMAEDDGRGGYELVCQGCARTFGTLVEGDRRAA